MWADTKIALGVIPVLYLCVFLSPTAGQRMALSLEQKYIQEEKSLADYPSCINTLKGFPRCPGVDNAAVLECAGEEHSVKWVMGFCSGGFHISGSPSALS